MQQLTGHVGKGKKETRKLAEEAAKPRGEGPIFHNAKKSDDGKVSDVGVDGGLELSSGRLVIVQITLEQELAKKANLITFGLRVQPTQTSNEGIDDEFAKSVGAKDLSNLKEMVSKQVSEELINSLNMITSKQIINQIEKFKIEDLPKNILDEEFKILTQGMKEEDIKKNKKNLEDQAKSRIKTGLIMNEFGEKNKITVTDQELQNEIQKQLRMMPGQEKMVQEYYQKNPSILANLRGSLYEEKIIKSIKDKAKGNKKIITKEQAEKIIKEENDNKQKEASAKKTSMETAKVSEKSKKKPQKKSKSKKVSKK